MKNKKIPRQVIILGFVSLFTDVASEMLYPVTPIFLTAVLGSSMAVVGIIEGLAEITAGLLKGYFGNLSDRIGKRAIFVVLGYGLSALSKPLPGIIPTVGVVAGSRVSDRVGKGIRTAPRDALLASNSNKNNTGAIFGIHRAMDTLGAAIGPLAAIALLFFYPDNYSLIFIVAFVPSSIAIGFTFLVKDKSPAFIKKRKLNYFSFWKEAPSQYKRMIILITIFSLVNSSDVFLILKSMDISKSSSLAIFGYVFFNIVYAAASYPLGRVADKYSKKNVFVGGLFVFSAVYLGFAFNNNYLIALFLFALYGIYSAATEGIAKAWVSDLIPDEKRGSGIGLLTMLSSLAIMVGSFLAGFLWDMFGPMIPFLISSIVSLIVGIIFLFIKN